MSIFLTRSFSFSIANEAQLRLIVPILRPPTGDRLVSAASYKPLLVLRRRHRHDLAAVADVNRTASRACIGQVEEAATIVMAHQQTSRPVVCRFQESEAARRLVAIGIDRQRRAERFALVHRPPDEAALFSGSMVQPSAVINGSTHSAAAFNGLPRVRSKACQGPLPRRLGSVAAVSSSDWKARLVPVFETRARPKDFARRPGQH